MADDEDTNGTHEECHYWQCKDMISNVPKVKMFSRGSKTALAPDVMCYHLPEVPSLHVVVAFFRGELIAVKIAAAMKLKGIREPGRRHVHICLTV